MAALIKVDKMGTITVQVTNSNIHWILRHLAMSIQLNSGHGDQSPIHHLPSYPGSKDGEPQTANITQFIFVYWMTGKAIIVCCKYDNLSFGQMHGIISSSDLILMSIRICSRINQ